MSIERITSCFLTLTVLAKENIFFTYIATNGKGRHFTASNNSDLKPWSAIDL